MSRDFSETKSGITTATPEPGLLPFSRDSGRQVRLRRSEVTARADGNVFERSHSGSVD